jgi:hypothetical protein
LIVKWIRLLLPALLFLAVVLGTSGCGGSSGASRPQSGGKASEFIKPGNKNNKYAEFGQEGSDEEREAVSRVLEENLRARAAGDWASQCSSMAAAVIKEIEGPEASKIGSQCATLLRQLALPLRESAFARANTLTGPVDVLMVKGPRAYALYHGAKGKDYAMPMENVDGKWKVGALLTREIP